MGCCLTTDERRTVSNSPPPEETVKEVLSETPAPPLSRAQLNRPIESPFIKIAPLLDFSSRGVAGCRKPYGNEDLSGEICSSLSGSATASNRDEFQERRHRSPAKPARSRSLSGDPKGEKPVGRSPGRRSDPSPNRVAPGVGSGYGRRRDAGESSGRRSRSPVTRSEPPAAKMGLSQSQSARRTGKSPKRVGSGLGERTRKLDDGAAVPSNESLENPLVSLECFIFL